MVLNGKILILKLEKNLESKPLIFTSNSTYVILLTAF